MANLQDYKQFETIEFDREVKESWLKKISDLLAEGWEVIDVKIVQNSSHRERKTENPIIQWASYAFVLGKKDP